MDKIDLSYKMYLSPKYIAKAIAAPNKIYFILNIIILKIKYSK